MMLVGVVLLMSHSAALRCYWCVGSHCLHAGSGEEIYCPGSCYTMAAELTDGISVIYTISYDTIWS